MAEVEAIAKKVREHWLSKGLRVCLVKSEEVDALRRSRSDGIPEEYEAFLRIAGLPESEDSDGKYSESKSDSDLLIKYYYFNGELVATRSDSAPQLSGMGPAPVAPLVLPPELYWGAMGASILLLTVPLGRKKEWTIRAHPSAAAGGMLIIIASMMPLGMSLGCISEVPTRYYHMGHLGGALAISKVGGEVDYQYRYSAYGEVRRHDKDGVSKGLDPENRREFTGYQTDGDTGLQYAGVRFYDPQLSQFLSHDPAELTANPYAYVRWDPLNRIDPSGAADVGAGSDGWSNVGAAWDSFSNWVGGFFGSAGQGAPSAEFGGATSGGQIGIETGQAAVPVVDNWSTAAFPFSGLEIYRDPEAAQKSLELSGAAAAATLAVAAAPEAALLLAARYPRAFLGVLTLTYGGPRLFQNKLPEDAARLARTQTVELSKVTSEKLSISLNYVVTQSGSLILGKRAAGGHIDLARGAPVQAAGVVRFSQGVVKYIDNASGHYQPWGASARAAAESAFGVVGRYIEKY